MVRRDRAPVSENGSSRDVGNMSVYSRLAEHVENILLMLKMDGTHCDMVQGGDALMRTRRAI